MKRDAKWFFNFFASKDSWCVGSLERGGSKCAVGHLTGKTSSSAYTEDIVKECNRALHLADSIVNINDAIRYGNMYSPMAGIEAKKNVLKACRKAILLEDPQCQLGKEYDDV